MIKIEDLKVGMKVMLRDDLIHTEKYGKQNWIDNMCKAQIVTVVAIGDNDFKINQEEGCYYWYTPEMIAYIVEAASMETIKGKDIIKALLDGHTVKIVNSNIDSNYADYTIVPVGSFASIRWQDMQRSFVNFSWLLNEINEKEIEATIYKEPKFKQGDVVKVELLGDCTRFVFVEKYHEVDTSKVWCNTYSNFDESSSALYEESSLTLVTITEVKE